MKKYMNMIFTLLLLLVLPLLLLKGSAAAEGVRDGLALAYRSVLPALLPAMVVCGMLGEMAEALPVPINLTLWLTAQLCGFPLGVRTVVRAYHRGLISRRQAIRLSLCCANASPSFLFLYAGKTLLGSAEEGLLLLIGQVLISLAVAIISGALKPAPPLPIKERNIVKIAAEGISGAAIGGVTLTGYIAFFSMIAALCRNLPYFQFLYSFLELTGGLAAFPHVPARFTLFAAAIGFSGCSVLLQNASFLAEENLPVCPMIAAKILCGAALPILAGLLHTLSAPYRVFLCAVFLLFLISFDKIKLKYYNKRRKMKARRSNSTHDLFQRY